MIIDLVEQSVLGSLREVELLTKFFDDVLWKLTLVDLDVLDILTAIKFDLKDADWFLVGGQWRLGSRWPVLGEVLLLWWKRSSWLEGIWVSSWSLSALASVSSWLWLTIEWGLNWLWCELRWRLDLLNWWRIVDWSSYGLWWLLVSWIWLRSIWLDWLWNWDSSLAVSLLGDGSSWALRLSWWSEVLSDVGVMSWLLNSSGNLGVSNWTSGRVSWISEFVDLGLWGEELSLVLSLDVFLEHSDVLLGLFGEISLSLISHVLELEVDLFDLVVGKAVVRSVDQILDGGELVDEDKVLIVSDVVDGVEDSV